MFLMITKRIIKCYKHSTNTTLCLFYLFINVNWKALNHGPTVKVLNTYYIHIPMSCTI